MANPFRSSNPILKESAFSGEITAGQTMTLQGTVNRVGILLLCVVVGAAWTWGLSHSPEPEAALPWTFGGLIGGLAMAIVTIFKKNWSPVTSPIYALLEGLLLGGVSALFEKSYPGIAVQAISLTFGVMFVMLLAYKFRIIQATRGFVLGVIAATGGHRRGLSREHDHVRIFSFADLGVEQRHAARNRYQHFCCHRCGAQSDY